MSVKGLQGFHVGILLLELVQLLADILYRNGFIPNSCYGVRGNLAAEGRLGNKVEKHASPEEQHDSP